jgi:hypothetical protein
VRDRAGQPPERGHPLVDKLGLSARAQRGLEVEAVGLLEEQRRHVRGTGPEVPVLQRPGPHRADLFTADDADDAPVADDGRRHERLDAVHLEVVLSDLDGAGVRARLIDRNHAVLVNLRQQDRQREPVGQPGRGEGARRKIELAHAHEAAARPLERPDPDPLHAEGAGAGLGDLAHRRGPRVVAGEAQPRQLEARALVPGAAPVRFRGHGGGASI